MQQAALAFCGYQRPGDSRPDTTVQSLCQHGETGTARYRGLRMPGQDAGRHRAGVLNSRLFGSHGEHSTDGSRPGTWRCMDSPLPPERTIRGNAATAASAQDDDSAQHPYHRISKESGGSKG